MTVGRKEADDKIFKIIEQKCESEPAIISKYYRELKAQDKSSNTIHEYIKAVIMFAKDIPCENREEFYSAADRDKVNTFMLNLSERDLCNSRRKSIWAALNSFFKYLVDEELIAKNPVDPKTKPKGRDYSSVTYLSEEEVAGVMENIRTMAQKRDVWRDLCWFTLGVTTGLRISAILQINLEDINWENKTIRVVEKGRKVVEKPFGDKVEYYLRGWITDRSELYPNIETTALFLSRQKNRLSPDSVERNIKKYATDVTKKNVTPHVMRHTCATLLYERVHDLWRVCKQLGHSSVTTTQIYAEVSDEKVKQSVTLLNEII